MGKKKQSKVHQYFELVGRSKDERKKKVRCGGTGNRISVLSGFNFNNKLCKYSARIDGFKRMRK